jgi:hypothetical protein
MPGRCREGGTVVYEVKNGPWDPTDDKFYTPWAPGEGNAECNSFNQMLREKIGLV